MRKAAALLLAVLFPALAGAADFDAASSKASRSSGRLLIWTHELGGGANRAVTVAVTTEDKQDRDPGLLVLFGTAIMHPVPGGVAGPRAARASFARSSSTSSKTACPGRAGTSWWWRRCARP